MMYMLTLVFTSCSRMSSLLFAGAILLSILARLELMALLRCMLVLNFAVMSATRLFASYKG